jgi:hypothetical protein
MALCKWLAAYGWVLIDSLSPVRHPVNILGVDRLARVAPGDKAMAFQQGPGEQSGGGVEVEGLAGKHGGFSL